MIKNYLLSLALCIFSSTNAQTITIPDGNFKAKLLEADVSNEIAKDKNQKNIKIDSNGDGEIQESEALQVGLLKVNFSDISSLTGIQKFSNLMGLECYNNEIANLDLSNLKKLGYVACHENKMTSLNLKGSTDIVELQISNNLLTSVDLTGLNRINSLACFGNSLINLDVSNLSNLVFLFCENNQLTSLNVNGLTKLINLRCANNKISSLDLSGLHLIHLNVGNNNIPFLNLNDTAIYLESLSIENNPELDIDLEKVDIPNLTYLNFGYTNIKQVQLSKFKKLNSIYCESLNLDAIDLTGLNDLESLVCSNNNLKTIDVSDSPKLKNFHFDRNIMLETVFMKNGSIESDINLFQTQNLKYICVDDEQIDEVGNLAKKFNNSTCSVNSYCSFLPGGETFNIHGISKNDTNNNGCDALDSPVSFLRFKIDDGLNYGNFITNETGSYSINVSAGSYNIKPVFENSEYFAVSPTSLNVVFPTQPSPFSQDFCIRPNGVHNDLEVTLLPLEAARPGFDATYKIIIKNKGNKTQWGTVRLNFNDAVLDFVSSVPKISNQITDNLSWNFTNLKPFETKEIDVVLNLNSTQETPSVNASDILSYIVDVSFPDTDEKVNDNIFSLNQTVVGSYDPNDKICLEGNVIKPELIGEFVHYMIRFENTGTYAAENIVIKDVIDLSKLDISTLVPTKASHSFITKISDGNKVEFIFEKINLPFNDVNNDGYIAFKIKTLPTLAVGDSFVNEANIYFDYNFPILTNKATSTFKILETPDFAFSNYFNVYPNPVNEVLNIVNKSEIEIKSLSVYDILGQLVIAVPNAQKVVNIDVSKLQTGNYILKINSDKGIFNQKFVKK